MTTLQKLQIEQSNKRQRVNELLGLEELSDEQRGELGTLTVRLQGLEVELRAAIVVQGDDEARAAGQFGNGDGEAGERGRLLRATTIVDYLGAASSGGSIEGRARELNAALEVPAQGAGGGVAIPWALMEQRSMVAPVEQRAFTTTTNNDGAEEQRPILQRLFGPGVLDAMGVRLDAVPVGKSEWPIITSGVVPAMAKEGTAAADAVVAGFGFANLKPKRLTGQYEYTHEVAASVVELEGALRRDLADAIKSKMSDLIINGAAATNAAPQNVAGLLTLLIGSDLSAAEATAGDYGSLHATGVDGIHAGMENEVMSIIGDETYKHAAGKYIAGSGESGSELLRRRSGGCMASTYIPAVASMKQCAILHAAGPNGGGAMRGDSVAAIWPSLEVIRDVYSKASQGVVLTWVTLWDAHTALRSAAYKEIKIQIESAYKPKRCLKGCLKVYKERQRGAKMELTAESIFVEFRALPGGADPDVLEGLALPYGVVVTGAGR